MTGNIQFDAFLFGIISAVSLPMGSILAMYWIPKPRVVAALMAFGGGALLAALTIDLVAETVAKGGFFPLAIGCIIGGFSFVFLNQLVNNKGGFLRKYATTLSYIRKQKTQELKSISKKISQIELFHHLPPEEINSLLPLIIRRTYKANSTIIKQGEPGDSLIIIEKGEVDIIDEKNHFNKIDTISDNDVIGELALLTGETRSATAITTKDTIVWIILKEHFDNLIKVSNKLASAVSELANKRIHGLEEKKAISQTKADEWYSKAVKNLNQKVFSPNDVDIKEASHTSGAPLAIWLGILLDGIPESLVIGSSLLISPTMSLSLLAGLFLSNFPEALSSSVGMRENKMKKPKILLLWTSLMLITGIFSYFGCIFFANAPKTLFSLVDGMAAGAMLTMIAETMLPEAFHKGGSVTGLSTLFGFLATIFFKVIEKYL